MIMKQPPVIVVQLVHLQGPSKGEIQEFSQDEIAIGRHPSCSLRFPPDLNVVSRRHADLVREGNRYKLIDHSSNGTLVNGKKVKEAYLKNGDVISFSEGGPKVSFLMQVKEIVPEVEKRTPPPSPPLQQRLTPQFDPAPGRLPADEPKEPVVIVESVQAPLVIQYGPTIRSFKTLPVTIGTNRSCDFTIDHPSMFEQHAQIFFAHNEYWIKDLTGRGSILINRRQIGMQAPMRVEDQISLTSQGPSFRFLGSGRLAQLDESMEEQAPEPFAGDRSQDPKPEDARSGGQKKAGTFFKKFF